MIPIASVPYVVLGGLLAVLFSYAYGHHEGRADRDKEMQVEIAKKNEEARQLEQRLIENVNTTSKQLSEANNVIDQKQTALTAAIRAGRVRLPSASCVQATASAPAVPADSKNGAESDEQTLLLIAQIAADGDRAINSLNACIDSYNQVREQLNAGRN